MDLILSIDTSDQVLGIDLSRGGQSLVARVIDEPRVHASRLIPTVLEVLEEAGCAMTDLGAVGVAKGPGSYTGLRIGVSAAKGLCFGLGLPLVGVPTMDAMARALCRDAPPFQLVTCLASRMGEVYAQAWMISEVASSLSEPVSLPLNEAPEFVRTFGVESAAVVGSGSTAFLDACLGVDDLDLRLLPEASAIAAVRGVAILAAERSMNGELDDVASFEPFYLKDFVAKVGRSPFSAASRR